MGNSKKILIATIGIVLILVFFIILRIDRIKTTSINSIDQLIAENRYTLFYSGEINKEIKDEFKRISKDYNINIYSLNDSRDEVINYIKSKSTEQDTESIGSSIYLVFDQKKYLGYIDNDMDKDIYLKKYIYDEIPAVERMYNEVTGAQYSNLFHSKDKLITVFGDSSCGYCNQLEKVINEISKKQLYDIYYVNFSRLSDDEKNTIYNLNIKIPKECTATKEADKNLIEGYSKPTTIVSKNGEVLGCIKGYYDYDTYLNKLKSIMEG